MTNSANSCGNAAPTVSRTASSAMAQTSWCGAPPLPGVVIRLVRPAFKSLAISGTDVRAGAGLKLEVLVSRTVRRGLAGLEILTGIPGTVGGAIRGNAGGRGGDISQFLVEISVLGADADVRNILRDQITFGYRGE